MSVKSQIARPVNGMLRPLRVQLVPGRSADPAVQDFIPARKTIAAARRAGMSVTDYIDRTFAQPGTTVETVSQMIKLAGLSEGIAVACEIGPGSGRYAEAVIKALRPGSYEVYETAADWLPYLAKLPNAVIRDCDGRSLGQTPDASVDLVHAHKVFVYLEFAASVRYLEEMARVVRPGGTVAFDIVTENCLDDATVRQWAERGTIYRPMPRVWAADFMQRRGLALSGSYLAPLTEGVTELMVFRREG
jgi:SAM-dependent methyltransferase